MKQGKSKTRRASSSGSPVPSRDEILRFVEENNSPVGKREIARAFGLSGGQKIDLKHLLREMETEGLLDRGRGKRVAKAGALPEVIILEVTGLDKDGEPLATPVDPGQREDLGSGLIYLTDSERATPAQGDRVLARLRRVGKDNYEASIIRKLPKGMQPILGVFHRKEHGEGRVQPTDRRAKEDFLIRTGDDNGAEEGELVIVEVLPVRHRGLSPARVTKRIGHLDDPRAFSLIAIYTHGIPSEFPSQAIAEAEAAKPVVLGKRTDFRDIPLVTIDGEDARDFDDAVFAETDTNPGNPGGWRLIVAIADVSWYVRPGMALDQEAQKRGNSVYFPDRVIPMLPEALSNELCSLKPNVDRACLAAELWIDHEGRLLRHQFHRGLMRSHARLTYTEAQAAFDQEKPLVSELQNAAIKPLYGAYASLMVARKKRGTLDLDLPERQVFLNDKGRITRIVPRTRYDSHRLIEEFMILANVAAAQALETAKYPCIYRIHDEPDPAKVDQLRSYLESLGYSLTRGEVLKPRNFMQVITKAAGKPAARTVHEAILRTQSQAVYSPENIGHFGLALRRYAHFTSPIRRYSDLLVHRALIDAFRLGEGGLGPIDPARFTDIALHISMTERRAATAERDALNRYLTAYMAEQVGQNFTGRIVGVARFGLFIRFGDADAEGLLPIGNLPDDWYDHNPDHHSLVGRDRGLAYHLGDTISIKLEAADSVTGSLLVSVTDKGETRVFSGRRRKHTSRVSTRKSAKNRRNASKKPRRHGK